MALVIDQYASFLKFASLHISKTAFLFFADNNLVERNGNVEGIKCRDGYLFYVVYIDNTVLIFLSFLRFTEFISLPRFS